jgi:hypothetical protein
LDGIAAGSAGEPKMRKSLTVVLTLGVIGILLTPNAGSTQPATYVGAPTPDLLAVANAIQVQHESLETLVTVARGLTLTRPVKISIAYLSPWPTGNDRATQAYVRPFGNRFLHVDPEGDGKPRNLHLDITLSEANPAGGVSSYNVPMDVALEPLYDVAISPLTFRLRHCNEIPSSRAEIDFYWFTPEKQQMKETFELKTNDAHLVKRFAFKRDEVAASTGLFVPTQWFRTVRAFDPIPGFGPYPAPSDNLVPGKPQVTYWQREESAQNESTCQADIAYTMTYQLRANYFGGGAVVRHHR